MAGEPPITVIGNVVDEVDLRYTASGLAVCNFRLAATPRILDKASDTWKDGETLWLTCSLWKQAAENAAETLQKGMRVVVTGKLKARSYEDREGVKKTVMEIDVDEVGPSLRYASAKVTKAEREKPAAPASNDPWSTPADGAPPW